MSWFCYRVEPQKEFAVREAVQRRGYTGFVPTEVRFRRRLRSRKAPSKVAYPMLVGYLFIELPPHRWPEPLHRFDAIKSVVSCAGGVACFSDVAIDKLREMQGAKLAHALSRPSRKSFVEGELVTVVRGSLRDPLSPVKIEKIRGQKATLIMEFLGVPRRVEIALEALEAA